VPTNKEDPVKSADPKGQKNEGKNSLATNSARSVAMVSIIVGASFLLAVDLGLFPPCSSQGYKRHL
jgi:hypothetical protein